jgi:Synaptic plasticity regulator PANTS-like
LPDSVDGVSLSHMFLTLVDCVGLRGRMSSYYRDGSFAPACSVEHENHSLAWKLKWKRYVNKADAQNMLDEVNERRRSEADGKRANHVWRYKDIPELPISQECRGDGVMRYRSIDRATAIGLNERDDPLKLQRYADFSGRKTDWSKVIDESEAVAKNDDGKSDKTGEAGERSSR